MRSITGDESPRPTENAEASRGWHYGWIAVSVASWCVCFDAKGNRGYNDERCKGLAGIRGKE